MPIDPIAFSPEDIDWQAPDYDGTVRKSENMFYPTQKLVIVQDNNDEAIDGQPDLDAEDHAGVSDNKRYCSMDDLKEKTPSKIPIILLVFLMSMTIPGYSQNIIEQHSNIFSTTVTSFTIEQAPIEKKNYVGPDWMKAGGLKHPCYKTCTWVWVKTNCSENHLPCWRWDGTSWVSYECQCYKMLFQIPDNFPILTPKAIKLVSRYIVRA